jgi:L-galactono-1,4-lactone dehydrogenase
MADMNFMTRLLQLIEANNIPAPAPIEQRWSSGSSSAMSIISDTDCDCYTAGGRQMDGSKPKQATLYSWVGIIMYLCSEDEQIRTQITQAFKEYTDRVGTQLETEFDAFHHWAKIEVPTTAAEREEVRARLARRLPVAEFNALRKELDPKNILANSMVDEIFGVPE